MLTFLQRYPCPNCARAGINSRLHTILPGMYYQEDKMCAFRIPSRCAGHVLKKTAYANIPFQSRGSNKSKLCDIGRLIMRKLDIGGECDPGVNTYSTSTPVSFFRCLRAFAWGSRPRTPRGQTELVRSDDGAAKYDTACRCVRATTSACQWLPPRLRQSASAKRRRVRAARTPDAAVGPRPREGDAARDPASRAAPPSFTLEEGEAGVPRTTGVGARGLRGRRGHRHARCPRHITVDRTYSQPD
ncbi:hypothetical protein GGX14DRAFT_397957 [Mycena pura]|uniref:Uncharacterized protein n=1 Tax=Mycena pura TaxID=153505 RepID=A0AAD6VEQ9_9AGAR|nr:hypothetical protein GGX14DRAFT_397957 [Mycena pura]